jgi:DNA-directed RNA polymerase subunit RPC12/RpoP
MDLFSLTCTTCKSRLKVRDEGAIGHILACPKCGGMVMVKPPEGWQPPATATSAPAASPPPVQRPADSTGATKVVELRGPADTRSASNFDAVEDLLSDAPPQVARPASTSAAGDAPGPARPRFVGAPVLPATPFVARGDATTTGEAPPIATADGQIDQPTDEPTDDEMPDWQIERPRKYWVLLAGSIAGGVALTVAIVLAINATRADPNADLNDVAAAATPG